MNDGAAPSPERPPLEPNATSLLPALEGGVEELAHDLGHR